MDLDAILCLATPVTLTLVMLAAIIRQADVTLGEAIRIIALAPAALAAVWLGFVVVLSIG
ncbi:hypothetical protein [Paracoccus sp. MKU1]|uniref:hypothetical protein n=1 Tax=Paracoccus sp. MKU1 TaxID=1745182 RepID=UPI0007192FEF|nr:hypothetical protein [Paracoccus sp. MKU1]KRW94309.1 hypothetical protein AQY21_20485 [Paracoccus sp. MKU1]